jgi:hypothetical protein
MKILALVIAVYTVPMLLIHVSTGKILKAWGGPADSWIKEQCPPQRAVRIEALYWLLALAGWTFWRSLSWKVLIVLFAAIHLTVWLAGELKAIRLSVDGADSRSETGRLHEVIVVFDLLEAFVLAGAGVLAVLYLLHDA